MKTEQTIEPETDQRNRSNSKVPTSLSEKIRIPYHVLQSIAETVGIRKPETGGILGGNPKTGDITRYHFDETASVTSVTYSPDHESLNLLLKREWKDVSFVGFVHSHPGAFARPSEGDRIYAKRLLEANKSLKRFVMPIIIQKKLSETASNQEHVYDGGNFEMHFYLVRRKGHDIETFPVAYEILELPVELKPTVTERPLNDRLFERVQSAYELLRMNQTRLVVVGCGGAASWVEEMARCGVGQFVLIDPDQIDFPNVGTQQYYVDEIGKYKVDALKERILRINPSCQVDTLRTKVEQVQDIELILQKEYLPPFSSDDRRANYMASPVTTVLAGLTDSFEAQSLVHKWTEEFQIPSICAQLMQEGMLLELTFTHPEMNHACHRCILEKRYQFFENGGENGVGSSGTPIFATTRINSLKGMITLALIHHGSEHPRFGKMLSQIGNRNLALIRFTDDLSNLQITSFDRAFKGADQSRLFMDETIWAPMDKKDDCPLCGCKDEVQRSAIEES